MQVHFTLSCRRELTRRDTSPDCGLFMVSGVSMLASMRIRLVLLLSGLAISAVIVQSQPPAPVGGHDMFVAYDVV
jgi:hypothetical protein